MSRTIWDGVGQIGDDLISGTDDATVRSHFRQKRRIRFIRYGSIAACLCLVICLCVPLIRTIRQKGKDGVNESGSPEGIWKTDSEDVENLSHPWDGALTYSVRTEKSVYAPHERPTITLGYGLTGNVLGSGTLRIRVETGDFTTPVPTEVTVKDFTYPRHSGKDANTLIIPLILPQENSSGTIRITFLFHPDDTESPEYAGNLSDGELLIGAFSLSYVVNEYEIAFSQISVADLFERRLVGLYEDGTIGAKEFADRYFAFAYRDTVCASVGNIRPDGSYNFLYRSKNIRYDSPYRTDPAIRDAMDSADERQIVLLVLEQMLSDGVLTQSEYETELAWVSEVRHAGIYDIGFDQNVAKYAHRVLQPNLYTHK